MIWQILVVLLLVAANGFFVSAEFALVKVRVAEIVPTRAGRGGSARLARHILHRLDSYLSACQLGITLASLGLGWAGEPLVARMIEPAFTALSLPEEQVHYFAFPVAFALITFLHLTVGEQAPKIAAIQKARAAALFVAYPLTVFYKVFKPFIWLINVSSNGMLRGVGLQAVSEQDQTITEDEVRFILTQSAAMGHLGERESRFMENVLDLEEKAARSCMVPRTRIVYLDRREPMRAKLEKASRSGHTRLPLCEGDLDNIVGIVHIKDVFNATVLEGELDSLARVAHKALFLPETIKLDKMLLEFQKSKTHMAILVDEYGAVSGLITLENVIEEVVGAIEDEFDQDEPLVVDMGGGRFEVRAACPIDEFAEKCGVDVPEKLGVDSVGGILVTLLGHVPLVGEQVSLGGARLTVLESKPTHVVRVLVEKPPPAEAPPAPN
jgi:CBS domain containing-hemolysin-like protein